MDSQIILIVIPQSRFCDQQLLDLKTVFEAIPVKSVILSKSGAEAVGEMKTRLIPDGILVDWDKKFLQNKKFDAVVVVGGKDFKILNPNIPLLKTLRNGIVKFEKIMM